LQAKIANVRVAAAHEGDAQLIVTVAFEGGGNSEVPLDRHASEALLASCEANALDELIGQSWQQVRDALSVSYNRYR